MTRYLSEEDRTALNAFVDGELDAREAMAMAARIASDPMLAAARDEVEATRDAVGALERPAVTPDFLARIDGLAMPSTGNAKLAPRNWTEGWQRIAVAVLITAVVASSATSYLVAPRGSSFETLIADAHRRSLLAASPVDVLSSDRHTVKPWFDSRLGISPPAPDLADAGFPLLGGRVEVVNQETMPTLVYRHNEHTISVFSEPRSAVTIPARLIASSGYNMVEWTAGGFAYTAVSDLEADELSSFVAEYQKAAGPH